jgi:hypothetical protein
MKERQENRKYERETNEGRLREIKTCIKGK